MKKQINPNWRAIALAAAIFAVLLVAQTPVAAQQKLKAGDRIGEVSIRDGSVRRGTVIEPSEISYRNDCYVVRWDNNSYIEQACPSKNLTRFVLLDKNDKPVAEGAEIAADKKGDQPANEPAVGNQQNRNAAGFQPGDRVELQSGHVWKKGTVVANEVESNASYVVKSDEDPLSEMRMAMSRVRALENPEGNDGGKKVAAQAQQKVEQATALCAGEPIVNPKTKGRAASAALFREVIRASFDQAEGNYDYKKVTKINALTVGKPYRDVAILIYPVKASLTTCEDAKSAWTIINRENYEFICYADPARNGEWTCGIYKRGTGENSIVPKPEANKITPVRQ